MTTTTSYGTWSSRVSTYSTSPDADVNDYVGTGHPEWRERLETSGALDKIKADYRAAVNDALPPSISLCGDEFIGPHQPKDGEFDGYPTNEDGDLDFAAMIEGIDISEIVDRHDPDNV